MHLELARQQLVGAIGVEATHGDAALLYMLDNFILLPEFDSMLADMAANLDAAMEKLGQRLMPVFERIADAMVALRW